MTSSQGALHWLLWRTAWLFILHHVAFNCLVQSQGCCDVKMMDASQQVVIDLGRPLAAGTYRGLRVRFCNTDKTYIQIWNVVNSTTAQLKWQVAYTPSTPRNNQLYSTIDLTLNPISIGDNDRLGLFSQLSVSTSTKMAVPYSMDALFGNMQLSSSRFTDPSAFTLGLQATLSGAQLKRTFDNKIFQFCTASDCSDQPAIPVAPTPASNSPPYCACPAKCSPDAVLGYYASLYNTTAQSISRQIAAVEADMLSLLKSTPNTGVCSNGTVPGPYGTGSCYAVVPKKMTQTEAAMYCTVNWPTSILTDIQTPIEQSFLYSLVSNYSIQTGVYRYWTGGMYSFQMNQYVWTRSQLDEQNVAMIGIGFLDFAYNYGGVPNDIYSICVSLSVDVHNNDAYWEPRDCFEMTYFICKMPKLLCY